MSKALRRVERNKGAPGVDGMKTTQLRGYLRRHWGEIKASLLEGTYKPFPVRRKEIDKPDGGVRKLGIPTVLDRLIQQAVAQVLHNVVWEGVPARGFPIPIASLIVSSFMIVLATISTGLIARYATSAMNGEVTREAMIGPMRL